MPFDPVQRPATVFAQEQIEERCPFDGLLPHGRYHLFDRTVEVGVAHYVHHDLQGVEIDARTRAGLSRAAKERRASE